MALLEYEFWSYDKTKKNYCEWTMILTAVSLHVTVQFFLRPSIYENFTLKIQSADEKNNEKKFPWAVNEDKMDKQIRQTDNRKKQTKKQQNKIEPTWYK